MASTEDAIEYLKKRSITICAAVVGSGRPPWELDLTGTAVAIVIGSEHTGLSLPWRNAADHDVTLPLSGNAGFSQCFGRGRRDLVRDGSAALERLAEELGDVGIQAPVWSRCTPEIEG